MKSQVFAFAEMYGSSRGICMEAFFFFISRSLARRSLCCGLYISV